MSSYIIALSTLAIPSIFNFQIKLFLYTIVVLALVVWFLPRKPQISAVLLVLYRRTITIALTMIRLTWWPCSFEHSRQTARQLIVNNFSLIQNFHKLPSTPSLLVLNYIHDRFENIFMLAIPVPFTLLIREAVINAMLNTAQAVPSFILPKKNGFELLRDKFPSLLKRGHVLVYGNRIGSNKLRTGIFEIAVKLGIPITPLWCSHIDFSLGMVASQPVYFYVGETFTCLDAVQARERTQRFQRSMACKVAGSAVI